jgi:hypothetical protein
MRTRIGTVLASVALLTGGALATGAGAASAVTPDSGCSVHGCKTVQVAPKVEGTFPISAPGCHVSEEIELQGSPAHDYMRWETTATSTGCSAVIWEGDEEIEYQYDMAAGYHRSKWYYDGPGHSEQVCVYPPTNVNIYCGRWN